MNTQRKGHVERLIEMSDQALDVLEQAIQDKDDKVRIRAAEIILQAFLQFTQG